jgi:hypothetical protein
MHSENRKVVIVDWDDTILPSTFVDRWQVENFRGLPVHVSFASGRCHCCILLGGPSVFHVPLIDYFQDIHPALFSHVLVVSLASVAKPIGRVEPMRRQVLGRSIKIWGGMLSTSSFLSVHQPSSRVPVSGLISRKEDKRVLPQACRFWRALRSRDHICAPSLGLYRSDFFEIFPSGVPNGQFPA